jgi:hypothetical protein
VTEAEAVATVALLVDAPSDPAITADEVHMLLQRVRLMDANGVAPGTAGWVGTYDLNRAAAEACDLKATRAANRFDFGVEGQTYSRSQVAQQWADRAKTFRRRIMGTFTTAPYTRYW